MSVSPSRRLLFAATALLLVSCAESPKQAAKKEPEKPPEPVTGRYAFHQMYLAARAWAPDAMVLQLVSVPISEVAPVGGKYGAWQCMFTSQSRGRMKTFTYSVVESVGNLHKGVFAGPEESFSGRRGQAVPFLAAAIKFDSDEVYQTAVKKSADYIKKHPNMPVRFLLEYTSRFPSPAWRVIWGESLSQSNYSVFVDASTGQYLATAH